MFCEHIKWQNDYETSLKTAKLQNKNILILILKKENPNYQKVFVDIFNDQKLSQHINKNFIPVVVFYENPNSYPIELFYTQIFPAIFFVSNEDESYLKEPLFGDIAINDLKKTLKIS